MVVTGGKWTEKGVYLRLRTGEVVALPKEGGILPGTREIRYAKVPTAIAVVAGPLVGLAYVIFLPFIGIVAAGWLAGTQATRGVRALGGKAAELTAAEWQPGMSHFARRKGQKIQREAKPTEQEEEIAGKKDGA